MLLSSKALKDCLGAAVNWAAALVLCAQGFNDAVCLVAQGFAAQGLAAQGLAEAQGLAAQGLA
ncbi:MAG: hypothetical protein ACFB5Z_04640, partial [Elainellaceae cyanobacterium]